MDSVSLRIEAVGRYLPQQVVTAAEMDERLGVPDGWVLGKTGVAERRWVDGESLLDMAAAAVENALERTDVTLEDVDLLLYAAATPHQAIPDTAALLQRSLGLGSSGIKAFSVHSTCLSFLAALDIAASHIESGRHRTVLIAGAEIGSLGIDFHEPESAALLGDMATAVVVTATPEREGSRLRSFVFRTYGEGADLCRVEGGGANKHPLFPSTKEEDNLFHMDGPKVFRMAHLLFPPVLDAALVEAAITKEDIEVVIPHQASLPAVRSIQRAFGIADEKVVINLDRYGNCLAASLPGAMYDAIALGMVERGDTVLIAGTGAGLSLAAAVLTW
jgi:3-oxoacyl-[acyl-carrier-protein] synthase-3